MCGCDALYDEALAALNGPMRGLPLATIFGERDDPLGFQARGKQMFPDAQQVVVPKGNRFPMRDDGESWSRNAIRRWHRERVCALAVGCASRRQTARSIVRLRSRIGPHFGLFLTAW